MAKKIRIDFSDTKERSGWNTKQMPEGVYRMKVSGVETKDASDGTPMLVYTLTPEDAAYINRRFPYYCKLQQNQLWKLRDLLIAGGMEVPRKAMQIDPEKIVGKVVAVSVEDDSYNGVVRSTASSVYSVDILEDSGDLDEDDDYTEDDLDSEDEGVDLDLDEDDEDLDDDLDDLDEDEDEGDAKPTPKKNKKK